MKTEISNRSREFMARHRRSVIALAAAVTGLVCLAEPGYAEVWSAKAHYDRGLLIVRGKTAEPLQYVSLSRTLVTRSNAVGRFVFRVSRIPKRCSVLLYSEGLRFSAPIKNCPLSD
ncbi:hypothetical protein [Methyloceanibacter sp. wino2]|uniref:hypothetical protein n=1 Tax=Methyloceanibacter sp. wino2 TaxID=2170729 RepID=UPI00131EEB87|nr:hypothetical protein [Methyloceanibacter sp. wino2]